MARVFLCVHRKSCHDRDALFRTSICIVVLVGPSVATHFWLMFGLLVSWLEPRKQHSTHYKKDGAVREHCKNTRETTHTHTLLRFREANNNIHGHHTSYTDRVMCYVVCYECVFECVRKFHFYVRLVWTPDQTPEGRVGGGYGRCTLRLRSSNRWAKKDINHPRSPAAPVSECEQTTETSPSSR